MKREQGARDGMNETPTCADSDTRLTQPGSLPVPDDWALLRMGVTPATLLADVRAELARRARAEPKPSPPVIHPRDDGMFELWPSGDGPFESMQFAAAVLLRQTHHRVRQ